eukprot:GHVU01169519.1.p1 GENE.GHVU01169519.1~~GHVU01169519.1.p1  ORF type:complete len:887 (-),score=91.72 GHVU01169519.1:549-3209(-)
MQRNVARILSAGNLEDVVLDNFETRSRWDTEVTVRPPSEPPSTEDDSLPKEEDLISSDDDTEVTIPAGDAPHVFKREIEKLSAESFPTFEDALIALYRVFSKTRLSLASHGPLPPNSQGIVSVRHRCEREGCRASLTIRVNSVSKEATVVIHNALHSHDSNHNTRMHQLVKQRWIDKIRALREAGVTSYRAYNQANVEIANETGRSYEPHQVSGLLRRAEKKRKFNSLYKRAEGAAAIVEMGVGEKDEEEDDDRPLERRVAEVRFSGARDIGKEKVAMFALINLLRERQVQDPDLYVSCRHVGGSIDYLFCSPSHQRVCARLFGQVAAIDDKHYVSDRGYQLVMYVVPNGFGQMEAVAFALIKSSTASWYAQVVRDCERAFEVVEDIGREWEVVLADQDSAIASGVKAVNPRIKRMRCWKHFTRNIIKHHRSDNALYEPIFEGLHMLLTEARRWKYDGIESKLHKLISGIPEEKKVLRGKLEDFFEEARKRKLCDLQSFTNGWNSQSVVEAAFSVTSRLNLNRSATVVDVVESMFEYFECREKRVDEERVQGGRATTEMRKTRDQLTSFSYKLFLDELNEIRDYEYVCLHDTQFSVRRVGDAKPHRFNTVDSAAFTCSCNMGTWKGIPCTHLLRVLHGERSGYHHDMQLFAARWHREQPEVTLRWASPQVGTDANACGAEAGKRSEALEKESSTTCFAASSSTTTQALPPLRIARHDGMIRPDCGAEFNADVSQRCNAIVSKIGHDREMLHKAADFVEAFESSVLGTQGEGPHLPKTGMRVGAPQQLRFKNRAVEAHAGAKRIKPKGKCSNCHKAGHNRSSCPAFRVRFGPVECGGSEGEGEGEKGEEGRREGRDASEGGEASEGWEGVEGAATGRKSVHWASDSE